MDPTTIITLISQFMPMLLQLIQSIIAAINPQHAAIPHLQQAVAALDQANQHMANAKAAAQQQP